MLSAENHEPGRQFPRHSDCQLNSSYKTEPSQNHIASAVRSQKLTPHVPRLQTPRHSRVSCALDDGAAVGEECHFVGVVPEFQDEIVVPDSAVGLEAAVH